MAERHLPTPSTAAFQERAVAELSTLNTRLNDKLKQDITREVYNRNVLKHKEDAVVAQIRYLRGDKELEIGSPESDVFVTPKASPSDPHLDSFSHAAYYSLVHLDENDQALERELAEQDELSKSFRSIIIKETQLKPLSSKGVKSKIPSRNDTSRSKSSRTQQLNSKLNAHTYQKSKLVLKLKSDSDEMSNKIQGQKEEEIMSNPDSCLEHVSSGYATGCSPRDTNGSEALGADTTEVATSEDIPHDDKSRGSSSVSSDPGTWDSTFPTNDDDTCIERENPENIAKSDSIVFLKETDNSLANNNGASDVEKHDFEFQPEKHDHMCDFSQKSESFLNLKMENKYPTPINNHEYTSTTSVSHNFFIDAASLRDENEMYLPSIRNPVFPSTNIEPKTIICDEKLQKNVIDKSDLDVGNLGNYLEKEPKKESEKNDLVKDGIIENRKLIRRNTFDLDPDDTTLTRLKEEYEKCQEGEPKPLLADLNEVNRDRTKEGVTSQNHLSEKAKHTNHDDDAHSPDSLNNDFHVESFAAANHPSNSNKQGSELLIKPSSQAFDYEEVSSTVNNKVINEGAVSSTIEDSSRLLNYDKNHITSDLGTSSEFTSSYESHIPGRKEESMSPKVNESFPKDNYFNKLECTPIVSGGAQISDVSSSDYSVSASPMTRRKTEFAPILSGGFDDLPSPKERKPKPKVSSSLSTSWVVDMSDVGKSPPESLNDGKVERCRTNNSSMGFFVPLDDPYPSFDSFTSNSSTERSDSGHGKRNGHFNDRNSACGFYIDLKESNGKNIIKSDIPCQEKKLFSMFIDIGNSKSSDSTSPKSKPGSPFFPNKRTKVPTVADRLSTKHLDKKSTSTSSDSGLDLGEHPEVAKGRLLFNETDQNQTLSDSSNNDSGFITKRQSFYMFIGNEDSPVTRRRTLPTGIKQNPNRHSWNNDYKQPQKGEPAMVRKEHKRSSSVSYDQTFVAEKITSGPTSIEETALKQKERKNKSMLSSWHGPIKPSSELSRILANGAKHEFKEKGKEIPKSLDNSEGELVEKAEDMSCSMKSDEVFDISNTTISSKDDAHRTFVVDDVSKAVNVNTNDLELSTPSHDIASDLSKDESVTDPVQEPKSSSSNATNKSSVCDADVNTPKQSELSSSQPALDNTQSGFVKLSDMDKEPPLQIWKSSSKGSRMSRSIPEGSWIENKILTNSASSRSLSRLFPHLYPRNESRDVSLQSSMHSSIVEPSPLEVSTEEEGSCESGGGASCRLGEDLLRMFLDEISPDVTVEVGGRRIKAHKCILSSRCQYFAGMLSGGWVESAGNVISLQGFSYNTVHFALCHIYSGASQIPETINIVELATLADMLCLEGLKEVIMYTLKVKYCHFFHKPCSGCLVGVVECLPLAAAYSLDEIYRKSLRWITKHFVRVWPTKGFASLPKELHDKCFKQHVVHLSYDSVLETVMGCDMLEATIPNVRWASPVFSLNAKLHEATVKYLSQHFSSVLASQAFMRLGQEDSWTVTRLEETVLNVSKTLSPDQACQSYRRIKIILANINKIEEIDWKLEFLELLTKMETSIEDCLIRQAGRAARTTSWAKMDLSLRRKIQEAACLVFAPGPRPASASRDVSRVSKPSESKPKSPAPASARKPVNPSPQPAKTTQSPLPKPRTPKNLSQVKSRYLEPKSARRETPENQPRRMSGGGKAISSSDSSRTSSPATARVSRPGTAERRTPVAGRRLNAPSAESPSPNTKEQRTSTSREPEVKGALLKRQSTFRVATKASSAKQVPSSSRPTTRPRPASNLPTKTSVLNNNTITSRGKQNSTVRSGALLRDESSHSTKKSQQSN